IPNLAESQERDLTMRAGQLRRPQDQRCSHCPLQLRRRRTTPRAQADVGSLSRPPSANGFGMTSLVGRVRRTTISLCSRVHSHFRPTSTRFCFRNSRQQRQFSCCAEKASRTSARLQISDGDFSGCSGLQRSGARDSTFGLVSTRLNSPPPGRVSNRSFCSTV